jgi:hypothetical protein
MRKLKNCPNCNSEETNIPHSTTHLAGLDGWCDECGCQWEFVDGGHVKVRGDFDWLEPYMVEVDNFQRQMEKRAYEAETGSQEF